MPQRSLTDGAKGRNPSRYCIGFWRAERSVGEDMAAVQDVTLGLYATRTTELAPIFRARLPSGWTLVEFLPDTIRDGIASVDYLAAGGAPLDADCIARAARLKAVHKLGVGYDDIDISALDRRSIPLAVCDTGTAKAVAEHAVAMAFAAVKNIANLDDAVRRRGRWPKWEVRGGLSALGGRTVGLVGFGRIARQAAALFTGVGCTVHVFARKPDPSVANVTFAPSLEALFTEASLVSLHVPLTSETAGMIGGDLIARLGRAGILINTSRGGVVDQKELFAALREGRLGYAALDVLDKEPPDGSTDLSEFDNLIVTPHIGGGGLDTFAEKADFVLDNLLRHHMSGEFAASVNPGRAGSPGDKS